MDMTQDHIRQIEAVKSRMKCPRDFECEKSGFQKLGRRRIIGRGDLVECLEKRAAPCAFAMPFGDSYFCRCPLRLYVAKTFGK